MSTEDWKYIFSSVVGTSHTIIDVPCQDSSACEVFNAPDGSQVLVAVVADGAGSAKRAEIGSSLACSFFIEEMDALFESGGQVSDINHEFAKRWLTRLQNKVAVRAEEEGLTPRDFASTLLAAVVGSECAVFVQIGDGAIVIPDSDKPDNYCWVFWPQQGQYANQTNFATDSDAQDKIEYSLISQRINEVAICTDGLQSLALHYQSHQAHTPFFRPIFDWLRSAPEGYSEKLSASLSSFLNSKRVNDCTDDDKTLILATRRMKIAAPELLETSHAGQDQTTSV